MDNLSTLCLVGILALAATAVLPRLINGAGARNFRRQRPTYNDPDIGSRASFGAPEQPRYDAPELRSRSSFGFPRGSLRRRRTGTVGQSAGRSGSGRADSPNLRSRGSFGRKRN